MPSKPKVVTMIPTPFYNFTCSPSCQGAPTQPATPPRSTGGRPRQPASLIACVLPNLISSLTKQLGLPPPLDLLSFLGGPTHTNQSAIPGLHPDCAGESLSRSGFSFTRDSMAPAGIGLMDSLATVPQGTNWAPHRQGSVQCWGAVWGELIMSGGRVKTECAPCLWNFYSLISLWILFVQLDKELDLLVANFLFCTPPPQWLKSWGHFSQSEYHRFSRIVRPNCCTVRARR